ncbi:MAG TPA: GNAT family N-acetyltransferase [Anaerolineales bacterium]|nr:GNAT family N-acetyltransferase [Anaerolineales bacterium]
MNITIAQMDKSTVQDINRIDTSFEVNSKFILFAENGKISYSLIEVPPYTKQYASDEIDFGDYISDPQNAIFLAYVDNELAGQIRIRKYWNGYAYIDDFGVDTRHRRQGVGGALMGRAIEWAKSQGFPGIMLETQNNNVAACRLYASCGFELRGFDTHLYKGLNPATDEIALYWYLMF